jgi:hypothetical protein
MLTITTKRSREAHPPTQHKRIKFKQVAFLIITRMQDAVSNLGGYPLWFKRLTRALLSCGSRNIIMLYRHQLI